MVVSTEAVAEGASIKADKAVTVATCTADKAVAKGASTEDEAVAMVASGGRRGHVQGLVHGGRDCGQGRPRWTRSWPRERPRQIGVPLATNLSVAGGGEDAPDREGVPHPYLNEDCVGATCVGRLDDEGRRAAFALDNDVINVCARLVHPLCDPDVTYHST